MKKFVLFLVAGLMLTGGLRAEKVTPETAAAVAQNFMERQGVKAQLHLVDYGWSEMYLFSADDGGFVLVAGDDCVRPILGYSLVDRFADTLPEHVASWMQGYAEEIALLRSRGERASTLVLAEWDALLKSDGQGPLYTVVVAPLLTTTWKQGSPYNTMCPTDSQNRKTISGCVAIALAQVMKYWNHPAQGVGSYSYSTASCGTMSANFGATTYDWAHMSNNLTSVSPTVNINAVAQLIYHVGVSVKMDYGYSSSSATTTSSNNLNSITGERALRTYFKYDKALHSVRRDVVGDSVWTALLEEELVSGRPVIFSGHDTTGGHAFICDGGNNAGMYHINWGWGGYCDGYYQTGALNPAPGGEGGNATSHYNMDNRMIIGIRPDTVTAGTYTLTAMPDIPLHGSVTGGGSHAYGDTVELTALAATGYRFARWSDGMCYNSRNLIMSGDRTITAIYDSVCGDTLGYDNGFYVTSWGYSTARPFYWGMKLEPALLAGHTQLTAVQAYLKEGTYTLFVYHGSTPSSATLVDSKAYVAVEEGWHTLALDSALSVNASLPLWIVFYNDDITYPACAGTYCGHSLAAYTNTNGTSWSPSSTKRTFLIRGIFHTPEVTHQLSVQLADSAAGSVSGEGVYPEGSVVEIAALATPCHVFSHWNDGVTENPRLVTVNRDTVFTAYFDAVVYRSHQQVVACDSFLWVNGVTYTESVDSVETSLLSIQGCDSVVMLTLVLGYYSSDTVAIDTTEAVEWEGFTYADSGIYNQTYQTVEGCDSVKVLLLTIQGEPPVGIGNLNVGDMAVFPNPTSGVVHIQAEGVMEVDVYDVDGRLVVSFAAGQAVDLGSLPSGTYLLRVKHSQGAGIYRVVKR